MRILLWKGTSWLGTSGVIWYSSTIMIFEIAECQIAVFPSRIAVVGHLYYSTERSYQAVIIQISSGPKLLLKVSSIPSGLLWLRLWTHDNIRWHVPTNSARSGEETLPEKRNSLKVITSITTILHDHAIVVDVQNGEFWELEWINMDRRTRIIASTSNVCRLRLLVLHRALNAITLAPRSYTPHSSRTAGYASVQLFEDL